MELVHLFDKLKTVRAFAFDVDGVFTDNSVFVLESGEMLRTLSVRDGLVVKMAVRAGFPIAIITGGKSRGVEQRFRDLGVEHIYIGVKDKNAALNDFLQKIERTVAELLYMGDDLPDLPVLKRAGVAAVPADAIPEVLEMADYISPLPGGKGCVRDILEKVMKLQGRWEEAVKTVVPI